MLQTAKTSAGPVVRVGVVGVGVMGSNHARVLAEFPGVVLAGVADPDRKQAHYVGTTLGCPAVASIEDTEHLQMSKVHNEKWRNWLTEEITKLGLNVTPSVANFVLIHFPQDKGKTAADADAFLTKRGLVLRALSNYRLPHALRMTVGTEEANRLVVEALRDFAGPK